MRLLSARSGVRIPPSTPSCELSPYIRAFFYAFGFSQFERGIRAKTTKPPAMRVVSNKVIQNNHHSFYNEGVQAIKIRKNGDYNG